LASRAFATAVPVLDLGARVAASSLMPLVVISPETFLLGLNPSW
jgi:hypothetical protein